MRSIVIKPVPRRDINTALYFHDGISTFVHVTGGVVIRETCEGEVRVAVTSATSVQYFKLVHVAVSLLDVNDNAPVFDPTSVVVNISEAAPLGKTVVLPTAKDDDVGENSRLSFDCLLYTSPSPRD